MKQITTILLAGTAAMFMSACGGGGGGDSEPNTNLYDLRTFIDIPNYTINGEGTITAPIIDTINVTGSYQSLYNGPDEEPAQQHEVIMTLTGEGITEVQSVYNITYLGNIISRYDRNREVWCTTPLIPADIAPVPTDAQVGYTSEVVPLVCADGSYVTNVIELNDAGGGNAIFSYTSNTYVSQGGALLGTETANIEVTPDMSMVNAEITGSIPADSITFALHSTSIVQD